MRISDWSSDVCSSDLADECYRVGVSETQSRRWIIIATGDHVTSEVRLVPASDPTAAPILVAPRQPGREYDVDEHDGTLFIHTNDNDPMWRLVTAPIDNPGVWTERIAPSPHFYITGRSEEHTSELQSLMRISYAVFCLTQKTKRIQHKDTNKLTHKKIIEKPPQSNTI